MKRWMRTRDGEMEAASQEREELMFPRNESWVVSEAKAAASNCLIYPNPSVAPAHKPLEVETVTLVSPSPHPPLTRSSRRSLQLLPLSVYLSPLISPLQSACGSLSVT